MSRKQFEKFKNAKNVSISEKIFFALRYLKINLRYYKQLYVNHEFDQVPGHQYINKKLNEDEYSKLIEELYGNQYLGNKYDDEEKQMVLKRWVAKTIVDALKISGGEGTTICDAGANKGYLMKAFYELGFDVYGFDILENKERIVDSENDIIRNHFYLGSILDIPKLPTKIDVVTCVDVFEHIPINYCDRMANQLLKLQPKYFVLGISKDAISDGHITLKGKKWWAKKIKGYRIMDELTSQLNLVLTLEGDHYQNTGIPRNGWNSVPGFLFLERI